MTRARNAEELLPCAGVRFEADFVRRLERLVTRVASARERREGAGRAGLLGAGEELEGYRPYRPGEDLRQLDWSLLARLEKPFVRVMRREAGERWAIAIDTSASMGVGPPGKLQRAAEVAAGLASIGLRLRADVRVVASGSGASFRLRRKVDRAALLEFLQALRASGASGLADLRAERVSGAGALGGAGRVFLIGDLSDAEPADVLPRFHARCELACVQILAPVELLPDESGAVTWLDPERGSEVRIEVGARALARYEALVEARLDLWRTTCARHAVGHAAWSSAEPFERIVRSVLGP